VDQQRSSTRLNHTNGYVLVACLAVVVTTAILVLMFLSFSQESERSALKRQYQDRGQAKIETGMIELRAAVSEQFQRSGQVEISTLSTDSHQANGSLEHGMYDLSMDATGPQSTISATETHNSVSFLGFPDDPFRGAMASTSELDITASAKRLGLTKSPENYDFLSLRSQPVLSVRQIPVSEFSLYSWGGSLTLNAALTPNIGRTYINGDLNITGGIANASYPVAASGNINLGEGAQLEARSASNAAPIALPVASTTSNEWLSLAKSSQQSTVLTGRDLPMKMIQALPKDELTASPLVPVTDSQKEQLRLWHQCSRVILEDSGGVTVRGGSSGEQKNYRVYATRFYHTWGPPVIVFDARRIAPGAGKNSFYIASTSTTAAVLVRNASALSSDLTIVTPHPILISGGFNVQGTPRAASLITAQAVFAVP
jgi:hypothetical protein